MADKGELDPNSVHLPSELVRQLRLLKLHAGNPTVRVVSKLANVPRSTVQDLLSGKRGMPQHDNFMSVVKALIKVAGRTDSEAWRQAWIRAKEQAQSPQDPPVAPASKVATDSASSSRSQHAVAEAATVHKMRNLEKAEADVKALELKVLEAQMSITGSPFRALIEKKQLENAKRRLSKIDSGSYLLR